MIAETSSSSSAAQWIRDRWADFVALDFRGLMHRAAEVAATTTDPETKATAKQSIDRLGKLWNLHALTVEKARGIAGLLTDGLGALIVWPAAAVIAVALSVAWIWTRYDAEYRVVGELEKGRLTPAEARQLLAEIEGGGPFISGPSLGIAAAGLAFVGAFLWFGRRAS